MGHLALLAQRGDNWVRQVGQPVKDVEKDASVLQGTSDPVPCPAGSLNPLEGQDELADCRECYAGKACTQVALKAPDVDCMQGFVCPPGSSKPNDPTNACPPGTLSNRTDLTDRSQCQQCPARYACLRGHFCPPGTMFPTQYKCPVGTWNSHSGMEAEIECRPCPQGWYCLAGSGAPTGRCSSGHYCPEGTAYGTQFPCPAGTYSMQMGNRHREDCLICPEGSFCQQGTSKPSPCPLSTFRRLKGGRRLEDCSACPAGYFCPHSATVNPRVCGTGSYSDEGSVECSPCLQGHYCSNETTSEEAMLSVMVCPPGFLCSQGLARDPQRSATLCPRGFYCPGGGLYCNTTGLSQPTGICDAGAEVCDDCPTGTYCLSGEGVQPCPAGHYCLGGGVEGILPCPPGTYSPHFGLSQVEQCLICPAGFYCEDWGLFEPTAPCQAGYYCLAGWFCVSLLPPGLHPSSALSTWNEDCQPCLPGYYCDTLGLSAPSGKCWEGFFCLGGADRPDPPFRDSRHTPFTTNEFGLRVVGHQNPVLLAAISQSLELPPHLTASPAPQGNTASVLEPRSQQVCPPGHYCHPRGRAEPSGQCAEGYYCPEGQSSDRPQLHICSVGHYCEKCATDSMPPRQLPAQTSQQSGLEDESQCRSCSPGFYCSETGLSAVSGPCLPGECLVCPAGEFCGSEGSVEPSGLCASGFLCLMGATVPNPTDNSTGSLCPPGIFCQKGKRAGDCWAGFYCGWGSSRADQALCPAGFFCPSGTPAPMHCPAGTFSSNEGNTHQDDCTTCTPGSYCQRLCEAGYYCPAGSSSPNSTDHQVLFLFSVPPVDGSHGYLCPAGHSCPVGSTRELPCEPGTYSLAPGAAHCTTCPQGTMCSSSATQEPSICPAGGVSTDSCSACPAGHYCSTEGLANPSGPCAAGFHCPFDFSSTTPYAFLCPKGHYCPEGSALALPCPTGEYQPNPGSDSCTMVPQPCPNGTYTHPNKGGLQEERECLPCPSGKFCRFAHVFPETGKYVFVDSAVPEWSMVVVVSEEGTECDPRASVFQPMSPAHLVRYGIVKQHRLNLLPDWELIAGSLSGLCDLEEFNVKTLYDKLEDQNLHIASQLARHRKDTQEFYRNICQQTETLKNVFDNMDHKKLSLLKELLAHNAMRDKLSDSGVGERDAQVHLQSAAPCLSDHDLSKLVSISPLFKTLHEIQQSLQSLSTAEPSQRLHNASERSVQENHDGQLIPTALDDLSPPHAAVFLFGCQVVQLLEKRPLFPSVLLLVAKSIPVSPSSSDEAMLAHCSGDFHFDATNQILYLSEAKLQHVGHFIAIVLQSMAHIASDLRNTSISSWSSSSLTSGQPRTQAQISCVEEEIDRLNESFLQLSMQLQKRAQMSSWHKERERSAGNHSARAMSTSNKPSLSCNGTVLLDLKRRYVLQRLRELQIILSHTRQCQRHGSESKDGTGGRKHTDSSSIQQGQREHYSTADGCCPTVGRQQDGMPAGQSRRQQTVLSEVLGNHKLEGHISDQQWSDSVQSNKPETRLDCQMPASQGQLHLNVPGIPEPNGQITIENTTAHTDTDNMWAPVDRKLDLNMDKC
ncbi:putative SCO-spondin-like [Scophthalmus maximus]|uniref:Putative SCO-spondin-like n=1 Tax=Scophthalmus maximus TaxID=52904 RepID=A0A2U9B5J9_SCOMX|nr:putative SCO-spondin-like [Scophthalmus maximus]